ncbi:DUF4136 domain-containing protein [Geoalkalibacter sp.]|uniref:DUF4136 domain-containing protein n=1 Tax=Geoalkalibacter sp. TaxID=3041440 RepID=UPI00272DDC9C|nr:DUF4136 domain-containing protein [Geoalkalibacter sp.]
MLARLGLILLLCLVFTGCAKGPTIQVRHDHNIDFAQFHSFQWLEGTPQARLDAVAEDDMDRLIRNAIQFHLENRGLQRVTENGDLLVTFRSTLRQAVESAPVGPGRESSWGFSPWAMVSRPPEASLSIDMLDPATKAPLWQGSARTQVRSREEARSKIHEAVRMMLAGYPPRPH